MNLKRVLLADGLPAALTATTALLQESFEIIGTVSNGQAAIDAVLKLEPDLAVIEISLSGRSGLEVGRSPSGHQCNCERF